MAVNEHDAEHALPEDARLAALYRSASLEEPPERLDRIVQDEARRALVPAAAGQRSPSRPTTAERRPPWWHAWRLPLACARLAVLSVSVVIIAQREGGEPLKLEEAPKPSYQTPYQAPTAPAAADAQSSQRPESSASSSKAAAAKEQTRKADGAGRAEAPTVGTLSSPSADLEKRSRAADTRPPEPFPGAAAGSAERRDRVPGDLGRAERRDQPSSASDNAERRERAPEAFRDRVEQQRAPAPPASIAPPVAAPVAPEPPPAALPSERFTPPPAAKPAPPPAAKPAPIETPPPPPAPAKAPPPPPAKVEAPRPAPKPALGVRGFDASPPTAIAGLVAELEGQAPRQWTERIALLRLQGRRDDADALLREFRRRYPDEPLPPDLQ